MITGEVRLEGLKHSWLLGIYKYYAAQSSPVTVFTNHRILHSIYTYNVNTVMDLRSKEKKKKTAFCWRMSLQWLLVSLVSKVICLGWLKYNLNRWVLEIYEKTNKEKAINKRKLMNWYWPEFSHFDGRRSSWRIHSPNHNFPHWKRKDAVDGNLPHNAIIAF